MSDEEMTSKMIEEYDLQGEENTIYFYIPHSFFLLSSTSSSSFSHILSSMSSSSLLNVLIFFPQCPHLLTSMSSSSLLGLILNFPSFSLMHSATYPIARASPRVAPTNPAFTRNHTRIHARTFASTRRSSGRRNANLTLGWCGEEEGKAIKVPLKNLY